MQYLACTRGSMVEYIKSVGFDPKEDITEALKELEAIGRSLSECEEPDDTDIRNTGNDILRIVYVLSPSVNGERLISFGEVIKEAGERA